MRPRFLERPARPADHGVFAAFLTELHTDDPVPELERWQVEMMPLTFFLEDTALRDARASGEPRGGDGSSDAGPGPFAGSSFPADSPVGYAFVEEYGERGYVRHVVVHPRHRGRGVGRALMEAIARRLRARGALRWELNVKRDNAPAIALYEALGMREQYSTFVMRVDWADVARMPTSTTRARATDVALADDAGVERAFGLPAGQVARLRAAPGDVLIRLVDAGDAPSVVARPGATAPAGGADGDVVGFARFNPSFPGSFPFRVRRTEDARTLLDALRRHARSEHTWLQLVIEDDAATARALFAAGARPVFEILHMHGDLP